MTEPANGESLAIKAKRLAAFARAKVEDERESQDQGQLETALDKLDRELASLDAALATHRKLKAVGVHVNDPGDLAKPVVRLREHLQMIGRPTPQFLNARTQDVVASRTSIATGNSLMWRDWAERAIQGLPLNLMPRLGMQNRSATELRVNKLRRLATSAPAVSNISEFMMNLSYVRDELAGVEGSAIDAVLARFVNRRIRLADLSDEEVSLLRSEQSVAEQLFVQLP